MPGPEHFREAFKPQRTKYKFTGSFTNYLGMKMLSWESVLPISPNDSRVERVTCPAEWFWGNYPDYKAALE